MNVRRHEILPCPGTCTSELALKTRVFSPFRADGDGTFSPGRERLKAAVVNPELKSAMKSEIRFRFSAGLGGRRAPPGGRKLLETMKCRPRSSRVHRSIASSTLSTVPSFIAIRLAIPSVLLASRARWPAKALATAARLWDLIEASTQGRGSYGVWRHVPAVSCSATATINTCRRR